MEMIIYFSPELHFHFSFTNTNSTAIGTVITNNTSVFMPKTKVQLQLDKEQSNFPISTRISIRHHWQHFSLVSVTLNNKSWLSITSCILSFVLNPIYYWTSGRNKIIALTKRWIRVSSYSHKRYRYKNLTYAFCMKRNKYNQDSMDWFKLKPF